MEPFPPNGGVGTPGGRRRRDLPGRGETGLHWMLFMGLTLALFVSLAFVVRPIQPSPETAWQRHPANPVIIPQLSVVARGHPIPRDYTGLGAADPGVLYDGQEGMWKMWFGTVWCVDASERPANCSLGFSRTGILYGESRDGVDWTVQRDLALELPAPGEWDATHMESPTVFKDPAAPPGRRYMLLYAGGNIRNGAYEELPRYQIGLAFSADGRNFTRLPANESPYGQAGLVLMARDALPRFSPGDRAELNDPMLEVRDGVYHLWMTALRVNASDTWMEGGIAHATSPDGIHWTSSPRNPLPEFIRGSTDFPRQPSALWNRDKGIFEMWYTNDNVTESELLPGGNPAAALGFWYANSTDGEVWRTSYDRGRDFRWNPRFPTERAGLITGVDVWWNSSDREYRMYYTGYSALFSPDAPDFWTWTLNLATRKEALPGPPPGGPGR